MIEADDAVFPNNAVKVMSERFKLLDPAGDVQVFRRPLMPTDPVQSIGVYGSMWTPIQDSIEMRGSGSPGPQEPTLQKYSLFVQAFVKDANEERGSNVHSVLSKYILAMLYRDEPLRLGLAQLSYSMLGMTERAHRWGVSTQRFLNNELDAEWLYLSTVECWLETETI